MKKTIKKGNTATTTPLIMKTVLLTLLAIFIGTGLFVLGLKAGKENLLKTVVPNRVQTGFSAINEIPYGDENLDTDQQYQEAMRNVGQGTVYNSPFGYTLTLPTGWHVVDRLTFNDKDGKREAFSPYANEEVDQLLKSDPYNPNYYIEVEVRENPKNVSPVEWSTKSNYSPQAIGQQNFDTTLAGYPAVKVIGNQGEGYVDYYVKIGNKMFNLGYFYTEGGQWTSPPQFSIKTFEDITSSFSVKK